MRSVCRLHLVTSLVLWKLHCPTNPNSSAGDLQDVLFTLVRIIEFAEINKNLSNFTVTTVMEYFPFFKNMWKAIYWILFLSYKCLFGHSYILICFVAVECIRVQIRNLFLCLSFKWTNHWLRVPAAAEGHSSPSWWCGKASKSEQEILSGLHTFSIYILFLPKFCVFCFNCKSRICFKSLIKI